MTSYIEVEEQVIDGGVTFRYVTEWAETDFYGPDRYTEVVVPGGDTWVYGGHVAPEKVFGVGADEALAQFAR